MKKISNSNLTIINFVIIAYFTALWLVIYFEFYTVIIGVFNELLTIPFLLGQFVFLYIGLRNFGTYKKSFWTVLSIVLLAICTVITVSGLF